MEFLKALFGSDALTFEQFEEKLKDNNDIKLANLAGGGYVDIKKHEDTKSELATAKNTIKELQETVSKFDGVDVDALKGKVTELENKYNSDLAAVKLDSALNLALVNAKVKNPTIAKAALDTSIIKLDGDKLIGLSEQLDALKESDGYLFDIQEEPTPAGGPIITGAHHQTNNNKDSFLTSFMENVGLKETKGE